MHKITEKLLEKQDLDYKKFHSKIVPDTKYEIIGVRMPEIRKIVKGVKSREEIYSFINIEHFFYEEYLVHGLLLSNIKNESEFYNLLNAYLPFIDNWAICDSVSASIKKAAKNKDLLYKNIIKWLNSDKVYTVRFAIVCFLNYFCESENTDNLLKIILKIKFGEYYIDMAVAWLLSVMLIKDYDKTASFLEQKTLPRFIQNKTIDKARDSFRMDKDKKEYLKTLKI